MHPSFAARRKALVGRHWLALNNLDIVAFSVTANPETGDYDDEPTAFFRAGQLPAEFDLMP